MKNQFSLKAQKNYKLAISITIVCLALFSITTAQAQETGKTTHAKKEATSPAQEPFIVKGNVSDAFEAIPGVNIVLQGTDIGTATDSNGDFEFPQKLKKGDVLVFSYVGLESQKIVIENKDSASNIPLDISLKLDAVTIMGAATTKGIYKSTRSK